MEQFELLKRRIFIAKAERVDATQLEFEFETTKKYSTRSLGSSEGMRRWPPPRPAAISRTRRAHALPEAPGKAEAFEEQAGPFVPLKRAARTQAHLSPTSFDPESAVDRVSLPVPSVWRYMLPEIMDLSEIRNSSVRHPWEIARAVAIERILRTANVRPHAVLDYGCGDGFTGERVLSATGAKQLLGFDIHLTDAQCKAYSRAEVNYSNDWASVAQRSFDLCLLCDVIEHVEDDRALLGVARERVTEGGMLLITVPAFQVLFSNHDRALKHFRRYTVGQLERVIASAGLEVEASGYLFCSLLPARGATKLLEAVQSKAEQDDFGIGTWNRSRPVSTVVEAVLNWDNAALLSLASRGIKIPGGSAWALCKQRRS
jgi:SAM-dependent methyltransferase